MQGFDFLFKKQHFQYITVLMILPGKFFNPVQHFQALQIKTLVVQNFRIIQLLMQLDNNILFAPDQPEAGSESACTDAL